MRAAAPVGMRVEDLEREAGDDDADEHRDDGLELAERRATRRQDRERDDAREQPGREERDAEEQVEAERGADELGQVGGHRDRLGLQPEEDARPVAKRSRLTSARFWPVAMPSFALIVWISIAIRFEARMTHSSR